MSLDLDTLFELLPAHLRIEDARIGAALKAELADSTDKPPEDFGPLRTLISIVATEVSRLEEAIDQLYDDHFIETCADWVAPYIGDLVGARGAYDLGRSGLSARALVADTIRLRRAKGTASALERAASASTLWDAVSVEYFEKIVIAQSMRLPRPTRLGTAPIRDLARMRRVGTAFDAVPRVVEVRRIRMAGGRWNIPNIGVHLFRLRAMRRGWSAAAPAAAGTRDFFFHPLGIDQTLFARPVEDGDALRRRTAGDMPRPLERWELRGDLDAHWDRSLGVRVRARGAEGEDAVLVDPATILVCDLPDAPVGDGFRHSPSATATRIDPVRGRLILADDVAVGADDVVEVFRHEGFALDLGGGQYTRTKRIDPAILGAEAADQAGPDDDVAAMLTAALAAEDGRLSIRSNALHDVPGGAVTLADDADVAVGAGDGFSAWLRPADGFDVTGGGGQGASLVISGVAVAGSIRVGPGVSRLVLADVTLVPGHDRSRDGTATAPDAPSLVIASDGCRVEIVRSVLGPIVIEEDDVAVDICDSAIVARSPAASAVTAAPGADGDVVSIARSTVIGVVSVGAVGEVSDSIFWGVGADPTQSAFAVARLQRGCVRFSSLPPRSRAPRRYRCVPTGPFDEDRPSFASLDWGSPDFCRLKARTPASIREGASDGGEMGVFNALKQRARERNLTGRLDEFTPFGMEAGFFYGS